MSVRGAGHLWFTHQPAAARWLKSELASLQPQLRFSYSRPGLSTFREDRLDSQRDGEVSLVQRATARLSGRDVALGCCPAHVALAWGESLGRMESLDGFAAMIEARLSASDLRGSLNFGVAEVERDSLHPPPSDLLPCLHVFERAGKRPADEENAALRGTHATPLRESILAARPSWFGASPVAAPGQLVVDVITAHAADPAEPAWVGLHRHNPYHGPFPGGTPPALAPPHAPSRAYAKLIEALQFGAFELHPGQVVLEIGSAPGGAVLAFLERGLHVVGIDPGEMAEVTRLPRSGVRLWGRFTHLRKPAAEVERSELPRDVHWIAMDVNMAPMAALKYVERFAAIYRSTLLGVILTLKIHDDGILEAMSGLRRRILKLGMDYVAITQLPSHRHEVVAIGRSAGVVSAK